MNIKELIHQTVKNFAEDHVGNYEIGEYIETNFGSIYAETEDEIINEYIVESDIFQEQKEEEFVNAKDSLTNEIEDMVFLLNSEIRQVNHTLRYGKTIDTDDFREDIEKLIDFIQDLPKAVEKLTKEYKGEK